MPCTKIFLAKRRDDSRARVFYGCAGDSFDCIAFRNWVEGGDKLVPSALSVMSIDEKGRIWYLEEKLLWHEITLPIWAIGSGADYAMGAMAAGKTAVQAIEIVSRLDNATGMGCDYYDTKLEAPEMQTVRGD